MAQMEKVTFPPLIALLQENAKVLNQALRNCRAVSPQLNVADVSVWFNEVIEPVFKSVYAYDQTLSRALFDVLYADMLTVLPGAKVNVNFRLLKDLRLLLGLNPAVMSTDPSLTLSSLLTALQRIRKHSFKASQNWINLMKQVIPFVKNSDELFTLGRIAAWRCGMAHLREKVEIPENIDKQILSFIFPDADVKKVERKQLRRRWNDDGKVTSLAAGSFTGLGGTFSGPPKLASEGDFVFASDGFCVNALFADRFGHIFQECADSFSSSLVFSLSPIQSAPPQSAKILSRYKDLTSWVHKDSTLYLTTSSSHSIFLFGAIDE